MAESLSEEEQLEQLGALLLGLLAMILSEESGISVEAMRARVTEVISDREAGVIGARSLKTTLSPVVLAAIDLMRARGERGTDAAAGAVRGPVEETLGRRGVEVLFEALHELEVLFAERTS